MQINKISLQKLTDTICISSFEILNEESAPLTILALVQVSSHLFAVHLVPNVQSGAVVWVCTQAQSITEGYLSNGGVATLLFALTPTYKMQR